MRPPNVPKASGCKNLLCSQHVRCSGSAAKGILSGGEANPQPCKFAGRQHSSANGIAMLCNIEQLQIQVVFVHLENPTK